MKKTFLAIAVGALVLATLACGGNGGGGGGGITLNNNSSETICYVYISPTSDDTWGEDQLGSTEVIEPGNSRSFNVSSGSYDLLAEDCSGNEMDSQWDVSVNGGYTWNVR